MSKLSLFLELAKPDKNGISNFINIYDFIGKYNILKFGNGGDWIRKKSSLSKKYKLIVLKKNGDIIYKWDNVDYEEKKYIDNDVNNYILKNKNIFKKESKIKTIISLKTYGFLKNDNITKTRAIRKDIIEYYKKKACVVCGSFSDLQCDHKNDLYNDNRVLCLKTQTLNDFQSLCNHCNAKKREVCKKMIKSGKRYSSLNIPSISIFNIPFTYGDETYDKYDINALKGTYWYDPIEFMKDVKILIKKEINELGEEINELGEEINELGEEINELGEEINELGEEIGKINIKDD
jgi:hypothetical protein